jgi:toxin ParE1/3/4
MKRFVLSGPAEDDLHQIKSYLAEKAGPTIARRVMKEIRSAMNLIGDQPNVGHVREDLTTRPLKFWAVFSYLIVYVPGSQSITVIRALHAAQDVEHLL